MKTLAFLLGALAILAGGYLMYLAYNATLILNQFSLTAIASAVQVTQVYSEASFYGIMAIASFVFAGVMQLGVIGTLITENTKRLEANHEMQTEQIKSQPSENKFSSVSK